MRRILILLVSCLFLPIPAVGPSANPNCDSSRKID